MTNTRIFPLTNACLQFIQNITSSPLSLFFRKPYKPQKDDDYFEIIKKPMDLSTVKKKLLNGEYVSIKQWENEVRLIFTNSILYNGETHLLGGISLYFLKKLDKFMENVENSNARNFEEKTKKLYSEVIKLLREMPAVDTQYMNDPSNEEIINQGHNQEQQNEEIQIGISPDTSQIQNEESTAIANTQFQNEEIQSSENSQNQNEENQTDISDIPPEEMYPFRSLEFQSHGEFDKTRMRKIKNDLNNLVPNNINEIFMLIHNTDTDFRCADIKEIDVASMSRRTLIAIEDMVQNIENGNGNNEFNKKPQQGSQCVFVRPASHSSVAENLQNETKMSSNSEISKESSSGTINISIDINQNEANNTDVVSSVDNGINDGGEISSLNESNGNQTVEVSNADENAVNSSIENDTSEVHVVENNGGQMDDASNANESAENDASEVHVVENSSSQMADVSNEDEIAVNSRVANDAGDVHVVVNDSSHAEGEDDADNSVVKDESEIQKVENDGN